MNNMTIFSITNSRSTHKYSLESLQEGSGSIPIVVLQDMLWIEALNTCVRTCETPFFLRVDDDFILHPKAVSYVQQKIDNLEDQAIGYIYFMLYETYTMKVRKGMKIYSVEALKSIGGFHGAEDTGRVDRVTNPMLVARGFNTIADASVLHLHVCGTKEEQERYNVLWGRLKTFNYEMTIPQQCSMNKEFLEDLNRERQTPFAQFLEK